MGGEEAEEAFFGGVGDFEGGHGGVFAWVADFLQDAERLERRDHRVFAGEAGASGVSAEFAVAGIGRDDERAEDHKDKFEEIDEENVAHVAAAGAVVAVAAKAREDIGEDAGEEHDKGVDDALQKRHGHHVAIGDVGDFMAENAFDFILLSSV